jgi:hypothetical protein
MNHEGNKFNHYHPHNFLGPEIYSELIKERRRNMWFFVTFWLPKIEAMWEREAETETESRRGPQFVLPGKGNGVVEKLTINRSALLVLDLAPSKSRITAQIKRFRLHSAPAHVICSLA